MSTQLFARRGMAFVAAVAIFLCGLFGGATVATAQTQTAVEYYYAAWNYYFVTASPEEIAVLDGGAFGGVWQRTGQTFEVWSEATGGALPTCRFFSTGFAPKSTHFYTPYAAECAGLKSDPNWQYEAIAFYLQLPDGNGNCPVGTIILYRLFNNFMGGAPNHRFTTSAATFSQMRAMGWIFEGDARTFAFACVPQSGPSPTTAEGFWSGVTNTNETIAGVVLDDGTFYFLYAAASSAGVVQGTATAINGQFNSSNAKDFNFAGLGVTNAAITGTYVPRTSLNGVITSSLGSASFTASYDSSYDQPARLVDAAGTYSGTVVSSAGLSSAVVTVSATGVVSGAGPGCSFGGVASPRGTVNVLDLSVTFNGGMCVFGTNTLTGIALYDAVSGQLIAIAPNASRTDGFLFVAVKQ